MTTDNQDFRIKAGTSRTVIFNIVNLEAGALDLTGASAKWWVGSNGDMSTGREIVLKKATGNGAFLVLAGSIWQLQIVFLPDDTTSLPCGCSLYHEGEITDLSGNVVVVETGHMTVEPSIFG